MSTGLQSALVAVPVVHIFRFCCRFLCAFHYQVYESVYASTACGSWCLLPVDRPWNSSVVLDMWVIKHPPPPPPPPAGPHINLARTHMARRRCCARLIGHARRNLPIEQTSHFVRGNYSAPTGNNQLTYVDSWGLPLAGQSYSSRRRPQAMACVSGKGRWHEPG